MRWKHINLRLSFLEFTWTWSGTKLGSHIRVRALVRRESCSGRCLEVTIGHCTFLALVPRSVVAAFHDVYSLVLQTRKDVALGTT